MNPLDWMLACLLAYSTLRAAVRGLFREVFAFAGLLVGFPLACWYYDEAARALAGLIQAPLVAEFAGFMLILVGVTAVATLLGAVLRRGARTLGLGVADRLAGAAFGLLRGLVLGTALLLGVTAILPAAPWVQTSALAPYFLRGAHAVSFAMPAEMQDRLHGTLDRLKHGAPDWIKSGLPSHTGS